MIVCYAYGGGLGHLTRVRAFLHTTGRTGPVTVVTASPYAPKVLPDAELRAALDGLRPDELIVDAFPAGLTGELDATLVPPGTKVIHLARLLRWDAYRPLIPAEPLHFDETWLVEPVTHEAYLSSVSGRVATIDLREPPAPPRTAPDGWLVVHAGPAGEVAELVGYARDMAALEGVRPELTVVSPHGLDVYPAWPMFGTAERIVTAAGCNVVRQLAPHRDRHRMMPFPRRFDDQYARAART